MFVTHGSDSYIANMRMSLSHGRIGFTVVEALGKSKCEVPYQ
jgi:hypothetical protein